MNALRSRPIKTLPPWLLLQVQGLLQMVIVLILHCFNHKEPALLAAMFLAPRFITMPTQSFGRSFTKLIPHQIFWCGGSDGSRGGLGLGMASDEEKGWPALVKAPYRGSRLQCGARKGGRVQHSYLQHYARRSGDLQRNAHLQRRSPTGTAPMGGPADQVAVQGDAISP
ncbi:hypothetical protein B296_00005357 [Ensete ventricosum]|uniref:Uncharacterized protein n=1 Tax=Ensete ventricosum TaxID=4639 RepID=A0A427B452_ENSVE|nr:hypothetical protein B296_00005357 [Ensete ventricosum]